MISLKNTLKLLVSLFLLMVSASQAGTSMTYIHTDHLGSPIAATDEAGQVKWTEEYQPFGVQRTNQDSDNNTGFTGHQYDDELELTYMQARWYHPEVGRFMSLDPVDTLGHIQRGNPIQGFNRYIYGNNNPYKFIDPLGRFIELGVKYFENYAAEAMGFGGVNEANSFVEGKTNQIMKPVDLAVNDVNKQLVLHGGKAIGKVARVVGSVPTTRGEIHEAGSQLSLALTVLSLTPCSAVCAGTAGAIDISLAADHLSQGNGVGALKAAAPGALGKSAGFLMKTQKGGAVITREVEAATSINTQGAIKGSEVLEEEN